MTDPASPTEVPRPNAAVSIYRLLFPVPVVCLLGALATDVVYVRTAFLMWLHFSEWLIAAGLATGGLAALALLFESLAVRRRGALGFGWFHALTFLAALVVESFNALVHTVDGWTAVVPTGLTLSAFAAVLLLVAVWTLWRAPAVLVPRRAYA